MRSMRSHAGRCLALVLAAALPGGSAHAEVLELGVSTQYVYNSNFFSSATNENATSSFLIGPTFDLSDTEGRFTYDVAFNGAYQVYVDQSGVNAWESRLRARGRYEIDARTSVQVTERFRDVSNLRFSRQDIALADTALDPNQDRYFRNDLELELIHQLTRLVQVRLRGAHHWIDFRENIDRNDSQAFEAGTELRLSVATGHDVGAGATYIHQDFEEALSRLGSRADSVSGYLSWNWTVNENILFSVNGGPSWIRSEEDNTNQVTQTQFVGGSSGGELFRADVGSCDVDPIVGQPVASNCDFATAGSPPIPASDLGLFQSFTLANGQRVDESSELTFFGGASIQATFAEWNLLAAYSRRQSTTSGDGLASSLDRINFEVEWAPPSLRWSAFVAGIWDRRETLTEATVVDFVVVDGDPDPGVNPAQRSTAFTLVEDRNNRRDNYTAIVGLRSAFTRNQSATLEFRYRRTDARNRGDSLPGIDTYFVVVSFDYTLNPLRF